MTDPAEVIDWIETALYDDENFRDIPAILTDARTRFVGSTSSGSRQVDESSFPLSKGQTNG
jgi:uncharacterized membrane-anchored protein